MDSLAKLQNAYPGVSCSLHVTEYDHGGEKRKSYTAYAHLADGLLKFCGDTLEEALGKAIAHPCATQDRLQATLEEIYEITEAQADGAPDANPKDKLANWIAGKLAPFIPTHKR